MIIRKSKIDILQPTAYSLQPNQPASSKGFTLIELSVVVFLIGLMLLIAVPKVRDTMLNDGLETTVNHLSGTARELRSDAVRNQVDYILHLDIDNGLIWTHSADMTPEAKDEIKKRAFKLPGEVKITDIRLSEKEKITDGEALIRFSKKDYMHPAVVHLAQKDQCFTLVFEPFLSSVRTYDKYIDLGS
ncbi:MAG: prepilin-type N-terminal cleavage/methylation domain-containing protein [Thermodesulfobacteriota bacterium]|nr:prepilin-type N-terminal cleavage/methylation domain-containing protein [Thermodesulfobacteriota bacterium]